MSNVGATKEMTPFGWTERWSKPGSREAQADSIRRRWAKAREDAALVEELKAENHELGLENLKLMRENEHLRSEIQVLKENYEALRSMALALTGAKVAPLAEGAK